MNKNKRFCISSSPNTTLGLTRCFKFHLTGGKLPPASTSCFCERMCSLSENLLSSEGVHVLCRCPYMTNFLPHKLVHTSSIALYSVPQSQYFAYSPKPVCEMDYSVNSYFYQAVQLTIRHCISHLCKQRSIMVPTEEVCSIVWNLHFLTVSNKVCVLTYLIVAVLQPTLSKPVLTGQSVWGGNSSILENSDIYLAVISVI